MPRKHLEISPSDFSLIYLLLSKAKQAPRRGRRQGWRWKDICEELKIGDHALGIILHRLKGIGSIIHAEKEGRETYYSIDPIWEKENRPIVSVLAAISSAELNYTQASSTDARAVTNYLLRGGLEDLNSATGKERIFLEEIIVRSQPLLALDFELRGRIVQINRCLLAMYLLMLKGDDDMAHLFAGECKRQTNVLIERYTDYVASSFIFKRELSARLLEGLKDGSLSNDRYEIVRAWVNGDAPPSLTMELPKDISDEKLLKMIEEDKDHRRAYQKAGRVQKSDFEKAEREREKIKLAHR